MPKIRVFRHEVTQPLDPSYRLIPLTQGQNAVVDTEDFERLSQWNWRVLWQPRINNSYAVRGVRKDGRFRVIMMHRYILGITDNKLQTDHKNHNTLDNRKANIRPCTQSQNMANQTLRVTNKSGFRGVRLRGKRWVAKIRIDGVYKCIGTFDSVTEAAIAYANVARKHFGEFVNDDAVHEITNAEPTAFSTTS